MVLNRKDLYARKSVSLINKSIIERIDKSPSINGDIIFFILIGHEDLQAPIHLKATHSAMMIVDAEQQVIEEIPIDSSSWIFDYNETEEFLVGLILIDSIESLLRIITDSIALIRPPSLSDEETNKNENMYKSREDIEKMLENGYIEPITPFLTDLGFVERALEREPNLIESDNMFGVSFDVGMFVSRIEKV